MKKSFDRRELLYFIILFAVSCINSSLIYAYLLLVFLKLREGSAGYLKICLLYTLRQGFYFPGLARMSGTQMNLKLVLLVLASVWLLINYFKKNHGRIPTVILSVSLFGLSALVSVIFWGSYPVAGIIKVVSFLLVLVSVILAAVDCRVNFDLETYVYHYLGCFMVVSFLVIPFSGAYMIGSTGMLFRGIWDHPNDFGVLCVLFLTLMMVRNKEIKSLHYILICVVFIMIYLSNARGAMIAACVIFVIFFMRFSKGKERLMMGGIIAICLLALTFTSFRNDITKFFLKNHSSSIVSLEMFSSREELTELATERFDSNPIMGRGLLIPYEQGIRNYTTSVEGIEPGNLFLELLAGTGVVGTVLFGVMLLHFLISSMGQRKLYVLAIVLASISEVSFFSVNNYGCLFYLLLALALVYKEHISSKRMRRF